MQKNGVSPIISVVLLVGFTILLTVLLTVWSKNIFKTTSKDTKETLEQFNIEKQINLIIENASSSSPEGTIGASLCDPLPLKVFKFTITNNADLTINEFIIQRFKTDGTGELIDNAFTADLGPFISKEYSKDYCEDGTDYFKIIPKVNGRAANYDIKVTPIQLP